MRVLALLIFAISLLLTERVDSKAASVAGRSVSTTGKRNKKSSTAAESLSKVPQSPVEYNVSVLTWNLAEKKPNPEDYSFLKEFKNDDFVILGVQECEDIKPRRNEGHRSRAWRAIQKQTLGKSYECLAQHKMGGLQIAVYAKKSIAKKVQGTQILDVACGVGNVLTNKGAVCVLLRMRGKTLAVINAHLAAHHGKVKERNADYQRIMRSIVSRAQPRWLNKQAVQLHSKSGRAGRFGSQYSSGKSSLSSGAMFTQYSETARKFGEDVCAQYQPLVDQVR
jgi:hypothetical protein